MLRRMLRLFLITGAAFVGACSDENQPLPVAPTPPPRLSHVPLTASEINGQIAAIKVQIGLNTQPGLFPVGPLRTGAHSLFDAVAFNIKCAHAATRTVPPCLSSVSMAKYLKMAQAKDILLLA
jgi:hypothetical protein